MQAALYNDTLTEYQHYIFGYRKYLTFISSERKDITVHTVCMGLCNRGYEHCQISEMKILSN